MGAARPRVTMVIPAYRNTGLRACLDGIAALDRSVPFETIVVLNDATDEVRAIAGEYSGEVQLADIPVNLGVSGAFNHGFALGTGEYLLELQDDSIPGPDLITALVARAEAVPDAGAIGALALNHDDEVLDPGMVVWRSGLTCAGLINGSRRPDDYVESRAVDYHGSVGMLIRRAAWESVGGLDDAFYPAYYGDVDLCFRLRERGWRVLEAQAHFALLAFEHQPDATWPFAFDCSQAFHLRGDALEVTLSVTNQSWQVAPFGLGWHPYFVKRAHSHIAFPAAGRWEMGKDKLPTHCAAAGGLDADCTSLDVDHCFEGWSGEVELCDPVLRVRLSSSLRRLVVFTHPTRDFVAVEPVSHVNNAVNLAPDGDAAALRRLGVELLGPGHSMTASMRIDVAPV